MLRDHWSRHARVHTQPSTEEPATTTTHSTQTLQTPTSTDISAARARNESTWRASAVALYDGDIERFLRTGPRRPLRRRLPRRGLPVRGGGAGPFRQLFGGFASADESIGVVDVRFHQTDDPDVVFVEERMVARLHGGGSYQNTLAIRVTFRGDLIQEILEYYGQLAHQGSRTRLVAGA